MRESSWKMPFGMVRPFALLALGMVGGMLLTSLALTGMQSRALRPSMESLAQFASFNAGGDVSDEARASDILNQPAGGLSTSEEAAPVSVQVLVPSPIPVVVDSASADDHLHPRVLYAVRTAPKFYETRLADVLETYLAEVDKSLILLVGNTAHTQVAPDHTGGMHSTEMRNLSVMATDGSDGFSGAACQDNHSEGVTCIEGRALFFAYERMNDFDWLFMVDDDVYVHRHNVEMTVGKLDAEEPLVYTVPGCGFKAKCAGAAGGGICGGGGYFLSRQSLERAMCGVGMTGPNATQALCSSKGKGSLNDHRQEWMTSWMGVGEMVAREDGSWWSDITAGCVLHIRGLIKSHKMAGLHPWTVKATELITKLATEAPLSFHYVHREEMPGMKGMHKLVTGTNRNSTANGDKFDDNVVPRDR